MDVSIDWTIVGTLLLVFSTLVLNIVATSVGRANARRMRMSRNIVMESRPRSGMTQAELMARFTTRVPESGLKKRFLGVSEQVLRMLNFDRRATELRLQQSGDRDPNAINQYIYRRGLAMIFMPFLLWFVVPALGIEGVLRWGVSLLGIVVGGILVDALLDGKVKARRERLLVDLPVLVDLLTIHLEAGSSFDIALARSASSLRQSFPSAANEVEALRNDLEITMNRERTLREFGERINTMTARTFVGIVIQSERRGSPMVPALRALARESRKELMSAIERKAQKLPTVMQGPMFLFILPAIFAAVIGPIIIAVIDTLGQTSLGQ